jgi:hypothetical protein
LPQLPLFVALILGGVLLVFDLPVKVWHQEVGSDLLAGISIVTAVLLPHRPAKRSRRHGSECAGDAAGGGRPPATCRLSNCARDYCCPGSGQCPARGAAVPDAD